MKNTAKLWASGFC